MNLINMNIKDILAQLNLESINIDAIILNQIFLKN